MYTSAGSSVDIVIPERPADGGPATFLISPETAPFKDHKDYPLHVAIQRKCSPDVQLALIEAFPEACKAKNRYGLLPLHLAMINGSDIRVVTRLLEMHEQAASVPFHDERGSHPTTIDGRTPLYAKAPKGAKQENADYPLHVCLMTGHNSDAVSVAVVKAYPDAVRQGNNKGNLPLHDALVKKDHAALIKEMVEQYPQSLEQPTASGWLPLQVMMC